MNGTKVGDEKRVCLCLNLSALLQLVTYVRGWRRGEWETPAVWLCPSPGASPVTLEAI